jgi:hypothetical protein
MEHNTIKVPQGNAWQLLLPLKTAHWSGKDLVTKTIDYRALEDVQVLIDGVVWEDWQMTEDGPLCNIPADMPLGPHNTVITATYVGVEVKASYFENFTIVAWSFESNVGEHLLDAPLVSEAAYIYVGITDDEELEALKQQYREATAACETARLEYEAAKEEFDEKAEQLDDVAKESTLGAPPVGSDKTTVFQYLASILSAFAGIQIDIPDNIATEDDVTAAKQAILEALSHIDIDTSDLAKQGTNPNATNTAILAAFNTIDFSTLAKEVQVKDGNDTAISVAKAIQQAVGTAPAGSQMATTFAYLASIYESIVGTVSPDVPEGVADRLAAVMKFFGIYVDGDKVYVRGADPEHSEQIVPAEFMTDTEVCDELEDIMRIIDPNLTAEQAAAITAQTLNPSES